MALVLQSAAVPAANSQESGMVLALQSGVPAAMSQESRTPFWLQSNTDPDGTAHGLLGARILAWMAHVDLKDEIDAIPVSVVALDQSTPLVGTPLVRQKTATRTVRTQKEINDADQAELPIKQFISN